MPFENVNVSIIILKEKVNEGEGKVQMSEKTTLLGNTQKELGS